MSGGVIPASTGRNVVSVGLMHPVIIRIVSFSAMSSFLVWVLRHQAGDAYSAALYTRAGAPVRSVDVYAPPAGASQTAEETVPWMTRNDLCNDTFFMFYVIIGPIYRFVRYEMKTKRLVGIDPLKQIRKPKTRFDLKWL